MENLDKVKNVRRAAKGTLTRAINACKELISSNRPVNEVTEVFQGLKGAYKALEGKHDEFTMLLDDKDFDEAEEWMQACSREYTSCSIMFNDYVNANVSKNEEHNVLEQSEVNNEEMNEDGENNVNQGQSEEPDTAEEELNISNVSESNKSSSPFSLKHEKPKLPKFDGDVRQYFIFKSDFQHAVEAHYTERDTLTILRSCLGAQPAKLIEGISSDLKTAWKYLDQNYGDPRVVSDTVTSDLEKFKVLGIGEDDRFCDLVNLVRRSYNILKEVKRQQDIDNTHVISLIERKMTVDDLRVWARHLNSQKLEPSMENLLEWMEEEMAARIRSGAAIRKSGSTRSKVNALGSRDPKFGDIRSKKCYVCQENHYVDECKRFIEMTPSERWKIVKERKACFSCLKRSKDHTVANCTRKKECGQTDTHGVSCKKYHHKLLHSNNVEERPPSRVHFTQENSSTTILPIVTGFINGKDGVSSEASVFYDSGAQISMIRRSYAESLALESKPISIVITKVGGTEEELTTKLYKVPVHNCEGKRVQVVQAVGIEQISEDSSIENLDAISRTLDIPVDAVKRKAGPVDLLIGVNYPQFHAGETRIKKNLVARKSPLGWVVFGTGTKQLTVQHKQVLHVRLASPIDLTHFWETESMGVSSPTCNCPQVKMSLQEQRELKMIEESCELVGKRWIMNYPWKKNPEHLPNNYPQVLKKLESTERRLNKVPEHAKNYDAQMKEMEDRKFSRKLTKEEIVEWNKPVHYVSHHAVVRPEKKSTPVRIVFNSSAAFKGHCLNDYWHKGPDLLNNLFGVILRFRENAVAVAGEIAKMYHMVSIPPTDQHVHRFLWRNLETEREPDTYVKTVLTFGDRPSPTMATVALRKTAELKEETKPKAANAIKNNTYVDDICDSQSSVEAAKELTSDIDEVLDAGGFHIKEWISNAPLNDEGQKEEVVFGQSSANDTQKVLGTVWHPQEDKFSFKVNLGDTEGTKLTKRMILSKLSGIFDPIGGGVAVLIKSKIAMQELWQRGLGWDDDVPPDIRMKWTALFSEMSALNQVQFERCLTPLQIVGDPWLVVFCDASRLAFGACAYIRWQLNNGAFGVRFVAAKSRVAPLKELTIPRLELQSAVLASRLAKTILEETRLKIVRTIFFSDSRVVIAWIQGQPRSYKPFVSCRISEIQSNSDPGDWFHCPTKANVADDLTKGISASEVNGRWFNGPEFLRLPEEQWPAVTGLPDKKEVERERRQVQIACPIAVGSPVLDVKRISTWKRVIRVTSYVRRFVQNLRIKCARSEEIRQPERGPLTQQELESAEEYWMKHMQSSILTRLKKGDFKALSPYTDDKGILRVGGRVDTSLVSYDNRNPALLPYGHYLSTLIVRDAHNVCHSGIAATVAKVRVKYWIIKAHKIAKVIKQRCVKCRRIEAKAETQLMAVLPPCRLQPHTPPFLYSSMDYFGPIKVKVGRNKTAKHYGVVFTCLNTRAIHCELAVDASAMELLQVLRRFFSIRGYPKLLLSDNGTQMVGADNELKLMIQGWDERQLKEFCANRQIEWKFITPLAPHQNGCSEAMVKSIKCALKKAIGDAVLTPFELYTCLLEVTNLVNQRPIGRVPTDPDDGSYLCPNDVLLGRATNAIPQARSEKPETHAIALSFVRKSLMHFGRNGRGMSYHSLPQGENGTPSVEM